MAPIVPPSDPAASFDYLDNPETQWGYLFREAGRKSQRWQCGSSLLVENGMATELLRFYADILSHNDFNAAKAVQNLTEFKHGGAINVALDQYFRIGLVWNFRPLIRRERVADYRAAWKRFAHVPSKGIDGSRVLAFLKEVVPMLGVWSLELARGYGSPTASAAATGHSEAEEELLVRCTEVRPLTLMHEDTAQVPAPNDIFLARMDVKGRPSKPVDLWEKIGARAVWATMTQYEQAVRDGYIVDPYTPMDIEILRIFDRATYNLIAA